MVGVVRRTKCCWRLDDGRRPHCTEQEVRDYCKGQISHQKIPRYVQFVESYPLTASGKVQKFVLREQAIKTLGLEEVAKTRTV
jgi:fatty-acyl-CoA synthase